MSFAKLIGKASADDLDRYETLLQSAEWEIVPNRAYQTFDVTDALDQYRAFFLKLPPHSSLHRHRDVGDVATNHVVIETNLLARNWWLNGETECSEHLKLGHIYQVDRTCMHWATNDGDTDRIHLLIEYK